MDRRAALPVLLNPEHGDELLALTGLYELAWATTWKNEANEWIAPRLGLPPLPYIDWPRMHGLTGNGTYWKTRYVVEYAAGRPFAWVDDEITDLDTGWVAGHHPGRALLRPVDPGWGWCGRTSTHSPPGRDRVTRAQLQGSEERWRQ